MRVRFGEWTLDRPRRELLRGDTPVPLTPKAFELLDLLLENAPAVVTNARIHDRLWPSTFVADFSVSRLVFEIRQALGDDARRPKWVRTSRKAGYAFAGPVVAAPPVPARRSRGRFRLLLPDREVVLAEGETILGRSHEDGVWFDGTSVSRHHARVVVGAQEVTIEDLGSKNGTSVQGHTISGPTALVDGDVIKLGKVDVLFRVVPPEDSTETAG